MSAEQQELAPHVPDALPVDVALALPVDVVDVALALPADADLALPVGVALALHHEHVLRRAVADDAHHLRGLPEEPLQAV